MPLSVEEVEAAILEKAAKWHKSAILTVRCVILKKIADGLVKKKKLMFWCTGGSVMYMIPERVEGDK